LRTKSRNRNRFCGALVAVSAAVVPVVADAQDAATSRIEATINGGTRYLYADPTICGCIYVGDQKAHDQYRQKMAAVQTATDEQIRSVLSATPLPGESGL
jgi:hypothetical protein